MGPKTSAELVQTFGGAIGAMALTQEEVSGLTSVSNADCWGTDTFKVTRARKEDKRTIRFEGDLVLNGDQDPEKPRLGTVIRARVEGVLTLGGGGVYALHTISVLDARLIEPE